jgi:hypothetical protein
LACDIVRLKERINNTQSQTQRTLLTAAWIFMLLASTLPTIVIREIIQTEIPEPWRLDLLFIVLGMVEWLVYAQIRNMSVWTAWQSDTSAAQA